MPANVAMGISPAHRPKNKAMSNSVTEWVMPATGVRPPFLTFVAVRAIAPVAGIPPNSGRSEEHTSELQSQSNLVCRLLLEKKKKKRKNQHSQRLHRNATASNAA